MIEVDISLENGFGRLSNESLLFYTYIALNYIYRGLKYIHKSSQHAPILVWQLTVVQRESKTWRNGRTGEGNHIKNIYSNDVTITIYGLVPDYIVGRSTSCRCIKNFDPRSLFLIPTPPWANAKGTVGVKIQSIQWEWSRASQGGAGNAKTTWGRFFWLRLLKQPPPSSNLPNKVCFFHASFEEISSSGSGGPWISSSFKVNLK